MYVKESYQVSRTPSAIVRTQQDGTHQAVEPPPNILSKLLKWTMHTLEIFWWGEDYCISVDVELEDTEPSLWNVHVEYSNGEVQDINSTDDLPDNAQELSSALAEFFE